MSIGQSMSLRWNDRGNNGALPGMAESLCERVEPGMAESLCERAETGMGESLCERVEPGMAESLCERAETGMAESLNDDRKGDLSASDLREDASNEKTAMAREETGDSMSLLEAEEGKTYIVKEIDTDDEEMNAFLFRLGCYSGEPITLISKKKKSCIVVIKDGRYSLDQLLASSIIV